MAKFEFYLNHSHILTWHAASYEALWLPASMEHVAVSGTRDQECSYVTDWLHL